MSRFSLAFNLFIIFIASIGISPLTQAVVVNNGKLISEPGYFSADVAEAGDSREVNLTDLNLSYIGEDIVYDYLSYIDIGAGPQKLSSTANTPAELIDGNTVGSSGSFLGANGNIIAWTAYSTIENYGSQLRSVYRFSTTTGTLGLLRFFQYIDQDVVGSEDDVLFVRGDMVTRDFGIHTVDYDDTAGLGVSQSGALDGAQGLLNAAYAGWGACTFTPNIANNIAYYIPLVMSTEPDDGACPDLGSTTRINVGEVRGIADVVSVMAWDAEASATSAVIVTTLNGIPSISSPIAVKDVATATQGVATTINILSNDIALNPPLTVTIITPPTSGSAVVQADNTIVFYPTEDFLGSASFTYQIQNNNGNFDIATVNVSVLKNDAQAITPTGTVITAVSGTGPLGTMAPFFLGVLLWFRRSSFQTEGCLRLFQGLATSSY